MSDCPPTKLTLANVQDCSLLPVGSDCIPVPEVVMFAGGSSDWELLEVVLAQDSSDCIPLDEVVTLDVGWSDCIPLEVVVFADGSSDWELLKVVLAEDSSDRIPLEVVVFADGSSLRLVN